MSGEFPMISESTAMQRLLNHCYFSLWCRGFYLVLISINVVCIVWTVLQFGVFPDDAWFHALEVFISISVVLELLTRIYLIGCPRFLTVPNLFDIFVGSLSVLIILNSLSKTAFMPDIEGLIGDFWVALRTGIVYLRLLVLLKNRKRTDLETVELDLAMQESGEEEIEMKAERRKENGESQQRISLD